jgi:hypothetical protein
MNDVATVKSVDRTAQVSQIYCWDKGTGSSDFNPITNSDAVTQVQNFRDFENTQPFEVVKEYGRGVIHRPAALLSYLTTTFCNIVTSQPPLPPQFADYNWGVGHFFMMNNGDVGFCVAPILFKPNDKDPSKTDVLDPFDINCPFTYKYGARAHALGADDNNDIYDMGEMWP